MIQKFHGLSSITLLNTAFILGLITMLMNSLVIGVGYAAIMITSTLTIIYSFCAKCPARFNSCGHVVVGKLATLFPPRKSDLYTKQDYTLIIISLLALISIPQYWLWTYKPAFLAFWALLTIAFTQINFFVCTKCDNAQCINCKKPKT